MVRALKQRFIQLGKDIKKEKGREAINKRWHGDIGSSQVGTNLSEPFRADKEVAKHTKLSKNKQQKSNYIEDKVKEGKVDKQTERQLELGETTLNKVYTETKNEEKKEKFDEKVKSGAKLTEEEIIKALGITVSPYTIWNFKLDPRFGKPYPGNIPAGLVFNTLLFFTKPGDLVVDPMAGGITEQIRKRKAEEKVLYSFKTITYGHHSMRKGSSLSIYQLLASLIALLLVYCLEVSLLLWAGCLLQRWWSNQLPPRPP